MDLLKRHDLKTRLAEIIPEFKPRPNTGRLWHDILFLLLIAVIQVFILPSFLGKKLSIELITPWLAISFIRQRAFQATVLALLGALVLEMHSGVPAGLYLVVYWIMANVIIQVRPTLSWRHRIPWLVTFSLSAVWVVFFEAFVVILKLGIADLDFSYWLVQLVRIGTAVAFGMYLCREWLEFNAEEPVPQ